MATSRKGCNEFTPTLSSILFRIVAEKNKLNSKENSRPSLSVPGEKRNPPICLNAT